VAAKPRVSQTSAKVSLADELAALAVAVEGAVLLLDGNVGAQTYEADATKSAAGVLALVAARLRLVRRVVRGSADGELLLGGHNAVDDPPAEEDDPDVRFSSGRRAPG
jgi:hypothetical protein